VLGRVVKTEVLNWDSTVYSTTTNTYNVRDQLTSSVTQPGAGGAGQTTKLDYDGHGRLQTRQLPIYFGTPQSATPYTSYEYFNDDTLKKVTDPRNAMTEYSYNGRHLVTGISYTPNTISINGIAPTPNVTFGYDEAGNRTSMSSSVVTKTYLYNPLSQMTSETHQFSDLTQPYTLGYEYNLAGQVKKVTDPWQASASYTYNKAGEVSDVTGTGYGGVSQFASQLRYRAWGDLKHITYGSNYNVNFSYNDRLQVSRHEIVGGRVSDYTHNNDGRLSFVRDLSDGSYNYSYSYDQVGRLLQGFAGGAATQGQGAYPNGPYLQQYDYDVFSHMTSRAGTYWYNYLSAPSTATYVNDRNQAWFYDAAGYLTYPGQGFEHYAYDAEGRLSTITYPGSPAYDGHPSSIIYDGDGQDVKRVDWHVTGSSSGFYINRYYLRSSALGGRIIANLDQSGQKIGGYVYLGGRMLADHRTFDNYVEAYHRDPANNNLYTFSLSVPGSSQTDYDPLGSPVTPPDNSPPHVDSPYEYNGQGSGSQSLTCYLDGFITPCNTVMGLVNTGAAVIAPPETVRAVYDQAGNGHLETFRAFADGYQGFLPNGATYSGGGYFYQFYDYTNSQGVPVTGQHVGLLEPSLQQFVFRLQAQRQQQRITVNTGPLAIYDQNKVNECLNRLFLLDSGGLEFDNDELIFAARAGNSTFKVRFDVSQSSRALGRALQQIGVGDGRPNSGATFDTDPIRERSFLANDIVFSPRSSSRGVLGLILHEAGNNLGRQRALENIFGGYDNRTARGERIRDCDVGAAFETCVFGGIVGLQTGRVGPYRELP